MPPGMLDQQMAAAMTRSVIVVMQKNFQADLTLPNRFVRSAQAPEDVPQQPPARVARQAPEGVPQEPPKRVARQALEAEKPKHIHQEAFYSSVTSVNRKRREALARSMINA